MGSLASLLTGVSNGINQYVGQQGEYQKDTNEYAAKKQTDLAANAQQAQTDIATKLAEQKNTQSIQGQVTPDMAYEMFNSISPKFGAAAKEYAQKFYDQNKRHMTVEEAQSGLNSNLDRFIQLQNKKSDSKESEAVRYENHQDKLEQDAKTMIVNIRGDGSVKRVEDQRDAAISAYNLLQNLKEENRAPSSAEYFDILAQLYKARTGSSPDQEAMKKLDANTFKGNFNRMVTYFTGNPVKVGATTAEVLENIQDFAAKSGMQADKLHENYTKNRFIKPTSLEQHRWDSLSHERGLSFQEATGYKAGKADHIDAKKAALRAKIASM